MAKINGGTIWIQELTLYLTNKVLKIYKYRTPRTPNVIGTKKQRYLGNFSLFSTHSGNEISVAKTIEGILTSNNSCAKSNNMAQKNEATYLNFWKAVSLAWVLLSIIFWKFWCSFSVSEQWTTLADHSLKA